MKKLDFLKVSFIIRTDRIQNGETPVYLMLFLEGGRAHIAIGQKVKTSEWDEKNDSFIGNNLKGNTAYEFLYRMKYGIIRIYNELKSKNDDITVDILRSR
jgi:Arm DNA-binding domain